MAARHMASIIGKPYSAGGRNRKARPFTDVSGRSATCTPASLKALARAGMKPSDIDLWELNEAFASVVLHYMDVLDVPHDRINVNGGAIAMGHPLGATGAIVLGILLDEMERRDLETGLVSLCIGAGMGTATIIERV